MHKGTSVFLATLVLFSLSTSAIGYALAKESRRAPTSRRATTPRNSDKKVPWFCVKLAMGDYVPTPSAEAAPGSDVYQPKLTGDIGEEAGTLTKNTPAKRDLKKPKSDSQISPLKQFRNESKPPSREPPARGDDPRAGYSGGEPPATPAPGYYTSDEKGRLGGGAKRPGAPETLPGIGRTPDDQAEYDGWLVSGSAAIAIGSKECPPGYKLNYDIIQDVCLTYLENLKTNSRARSKTDPEVVKFCSKYLNPKALKSKINKAICQAYQKAVGCAFIGGSDCESPAEAMSKAGISNKDMMQALEDASKWCAGIAAYTK